MADVNDLLLTLMTQPDVSTTVGQHRQEQLANQQALATYQQAQQERLRTNAARDAWISNPTQDNLRAYMALDPKNSEAIKRNFDAQDETVKRNNLQSWSAVKGYLANGKTDAALEIIRRQRDADAKAGQPTDDDDQMIEIIQSDPRAALAITDYHLASALGQDKYAESFSSMQKLPGEIKQQAATLEGTEATTQSTLATADKTRADTAEVAPNAQAERDFKAAQAQRFTAQTAYEAERLKLDRDTLESNIQLKLMEFQNRPMSDQTSKLVNDQVRASEIARLLGNRAKTLADQLETSNASGGWGTTGPALVTMVTGDKSAVQMLRDEYQQLIGQQAVKNLPPGPASDKDIQLALKGMPPSSASKETMVSFLRGMAKLQERVAASEQAQADWASQNNGLGRLRNDALINGTLVPAGTSWSEFRTNQSAFEKKDAAQSRSYMRFAQ